MEPLAGTPHPASSGHLIGDYDAGYYGYLWSKVYALNINDKFGQDGMTNQTVGMKYRQEILAPGFMHDGNVLREKLPWEGSRVDALYRYFGLNVSTGASGANRLPLSLPSPNPLLQLLPMRPVPVQFPATFAPEER